MHAPDAQTSVPSTEAVGAWLGWGVLVGGTGSARLGDGRATVVPPVKGGCGMGWDGDLPVVDWWQDGRD
jgi:hypothetical protein